MVEVCYSIRTRQAAQSSATCHFAVYSGFDLDPKKSMGVYSLIPLYLNIVFKYFPVSQAFSADGCMVFKHILSARQEHIVVLSEIIPN